MANITVTRTGTVSTVTLDTPNPATLINGDVFTETGYILDATNPSYDLFADGYNADVIARDTALQSALDAGEVTVDANGTAITTGAKLAELGTGNILTDQDNQTLSAVLTEGNTSGANNILMDTTQAVQFGTNTAQHIKDLNTNQVQLGVNRELMIPIGGSADNTVWSLDDAAIKAASDIQTFAINFPDGQMVWSQDGAIFGISDFKGITASRTWTHPDKPGTYAMTSDIPTKIFEFSEAEAEANTSSTVVWINALTHATASISPGNYRVTFSYEKDNAANNVITDIRGTINGTEYLFDGAAVRANQWNAHGGSKVVNFSFGGNQTITIDFRSPSGTTAGIRRARLTVESINI